MREVGVFGRLGLPSVPEGISSPDSVLVPQHFRGLGRVVLLPGQRAPPSETCFVVRGGVATPPRRGLPSVRPTARVLFPRGVVPGEWLPCHVPLISTPLAGTAWGPGLLQAEPALFAQVAFLPSGRGDRQGGELQTGLFGFPGTTWRRP